MSTNPGTPQMAGTIGLNFLPAMRAAELFRQQMARTNASILQLQKTASSPIAMQALASQKEMVNLKHKESIITKNIAQAELARARTQQILARAGQQSLATKNQELMVQQRLLQVQAQREKLQSAMIAKEIQQLKLLQQQQALILGGAGGGAGGSGGPYGPGGYSFMGSLSHRAGWFASSLAFFGSGMIMAGITRGMSEVEMGMIQLERVSSDVNFNFDIMKEKLFEIGQAYGQSWTVVQDVALRWQQAGYDMADTLLLTEKSLMAVNVAEMDVQQSTMGMIAVMQQWDLEAEQLEQVIDAINITADNYAVTSQDLIDGMVRSSGTARAMGVSFEQNIAILTALREATGRTGREVGNAWNSIMSYMQRDKALKTFEELGVNVWSDDTKTEFASMMHIFDQISDKWDSSSGEIKDGFVAAAHEAGLFTEEVAQAMGVTSEWDALQRRDLSQAAAGVYRRNYLLALIGNWKKTYEVLENMEDSLGYSMKENERTMEAYAKKVESLRISFTALADSIGQAGLLDAMKSLVDSITSGVNSFRELPEDVQMATIKIAGLGAAFLVLNVGMRTFMGVGIGSFFINLAARISGATAATMGLGTALTILARHPLAWVATALGTVVVALSIYSKNQERAIQQAVNATQMAQEHASNVNSLAREYESLTEKNKLNNAEQERLDALMQGIAAVFPQVISQWDAQGRAVAINNDLLRENIALANHAVKANALAGYEAARAKIQRLEGKREMMGSGDFWGDILGSQYGVPIMSSTEKATENRQIETSLKAARAERDRFAAIISGGGEWDDLNSGAISIGGSRDGSASGGGGEENKGKDPPTWLQKFIEALDKVVPPNIIESLLQVESTLAATSRQTDMLAWSQNNLTEKLANNQITAAEYTDLQHTLQQRLFLTKQQTDALTSQNDTLSQQLPYLNSQLKVAADRYDAMVAAQNVDEQYAALEAYDKTAKAIQAIEDKIHANNQALAEAARQTEEFKLQLKAMGEIGWESAYQLEQRLNDMRNPFQAYIDYVRKARELEHKAEIKRIENERDASIKALEDRRDAYIEASNARIAAWQAELDAMALERELNKEAEELAEREEELLKAQQRLANLEADVRVLNEEGEWEYIVDPAKLAEAEADVAQAEKALTETQENIAYNARRKELQNLIDHEHEQQRIQTESYNKQIENQRKHWETKITEANAFWTALLEEDRIRGEAWLEHTQGTLDRSVEMWREYYNKIRAVARESWGSYASPSGPSGGGGGGGGSSDGGSDSDSPSWDTGTSGTPWDAGYGSYDDWADAGFPSYDKGGPIERTGLAMVHSGEYVIPRNIVRSLNLTSSTSPRELLFIGGHSQSTVTHVDRSTKLLGDVKIQHVQDVSGFVRNLKMYAAQG